MYCVYEPVNSDDKPKYALVKVRLCATCSAKLNANKKHREVIRERNRLALLKEQESQIDQEREKLRNQKRKRELEDKASTSGSKKQRLTDKEQKEKVALDEAELGTTSKGTFSSKVLFRCTDYKDAFIFISYECYES